ncbi:MAG: methylmalonyl Co-A mutase-associated GTPase MeaB [Vicinamibacterales bacterium]
MTESPLLERLFAAEPRAIARVLSMVENEDPAASQLMAAVHSRIGGVFVVGVTGPPGAGKSTLVAQLITRIRATGRRVAVLAVDPSSPYSGGALLGDRVRMQEHASDKGVFIRSMATRGHLGGLARTTADAAAVLGAAGFDLVIIETVGVGQDEVEVVRAADVSVVTLVPGTGDDVQALKAGVMEIADIFVINKADLPGAERAAEAIGMALSLEERPSAGWRPPVLRVTATTGDGVPALLAAIDHFRTSRGPNGHVRRRERLEVALREHATARWLQHLEHETLGPGDWQGLVDRLASGNIDRDAAVEWLLHRAASAARAQASTSPLLDHVGVAVRDVAASRQFFEGVLGFAMQPVEEVPSQHVRVAFLETGDSKVELVETTREDSAVGRFLARHGPGLHHLAFRVTDLDATLAHLTACGVRLVDAQPRAGAHGRRVAFVHPQSAHGVLVELVEELRDGHEDR